MLEAIANVPQARKTETDGSQNPRLAGPRGELPLQPSLSRLGAWLLSTVLCAGPAFWGGSAAAISFIAIAVDAPVSLAQAERVRLRSYTFNPSLNHLVINTSGPVNPNTLILDRPSPTRVVVNLPNAVWGRPERTQQYTGKIKSMRISQFDPQTARFVLDLAPGTTVSQSDIVLEKTAPNSWIVKLNVGGTTAAVPPLEPLLPRQSTTSSSNASGVPPLPPQLRPQRSTLPLPSRPTTINSPTTNPPTSTPPLGPPPTLSNVFSPPAAPPIAIAGPTTRVLGIQDTSEGFFIRTSGRPQVSTRLVLDPNRIVVDIVNGSISGLNESKQRSVSRLGVSSLRYGQWQKNIARIVLDVDASSTDWEATYDAARGGVRLYPAGGAASATLIPSIPAGQAQGPIANINSVQVQGNRLVVNADGFLFYTSGWDPKTNDYRLSVTPARLPQSLPNPGLSSNSPVELIRFEQVNPRTVSILIKPSNGYTIAEKASNQGTRRIDLDIKMISALPGPNSGFTITRPPSTRPVQPTVPSQPVAPPVRPANPSGITVALDAGHGGRDPGAIGVGGVQEKRVNLAITQRVQQLLSARGYNVIMTRSDDREILLQPRIDTAVRSRASILVSIHTNALNRSNISGAETYYLRPDSARLAAVMHKNIVAGSGAVDRKIRRARFFMVRYTPTSMPSVLLELGYLTNPAEGQRLATPDYQARLAQAIANGIEEYFGRR
ncbi:MAG: N-acetylmuramoyl-L-alanine amidase [Cyanobacteria bacterium P01_E01_bin.48]